MNNRRIMIIGCGGSGKSTLARQIGQLANLPVTHLDQLFWRQGWNHVTEEEFDVLLNEVIFKDQWIIDGNFNRTIEIRLQRCDTAILLDYSRWVCLFRVGKRILTNWGKTRPDMGEDCPEKLDFEFLKWIWTFNRQHRNQYYILLDQYRNKEIYILHKRSECKKLLEKLSQKVVL